MRCGGCLARFAMTESFYFYLHLWIDNNLSYLDALVLVDLQAGDADFRRDSWSTYHNLHMCRLGVCPQ
eukprot:scaffold23306_cov125-Isochrysis_galbana.AAC.14